MSEDIEGKPILATGFVLTPYTNPLGENKPFRILVWTYGTAGGTRQCVPLNHRALYYEWQGPLALVQQGYVVIAPDYAGQGSDISQGFIWLQYPDFLDWQKQFNGAGPHALAAPMLVAQGEADTPTYAKYAEEDFNATCKDFPESTAEYKLYPDLEHDSLAEASKAGYLPWIVDRFNIVTLPGGCKKTVATPATKKFGIIGQTWVSSSLR
ncbi:hypothetical protein ACHAPU_008174 [Fusarium lateritium]